MTASWRFLTFDDDEGQAGAAPHRQPRAGSGREDAAPRGQAGHRPGHRQRLLLRLRRATSPSPPSSSRKWRRKCSRIVKKNDTHRALRAAPGGGHRVHGGKGRALQGRADRRPARGRAHFLLHVRATSPTCAPARTCPPPARSRPSSSPPSPALTGAATKRTRCCSASTARPSPTRPSWTPIWPRMEEAKKRDHRKLGRELDLFDIRGRGPRLPVLLPQGHDPAQPAGRLLARDPPRGRL